MAAKKQAAAAAAITLDDVRNNLSALNTDELRAIVLTLSGVRAADTHSSRAELEDYILSGVIPAATSVEFLRAELMEYISTYRDELSLPCDGDCTKHSDAVVTVCFEELMRDLEGS